LGSPNLPHKKEDIALDAITSKYYNAGRLFKIAKDAYQQVMGQTFDPRAGNNVPIIAIIFSASALEAFINELGDTDLYDFLFSKPPESVQAFAAMMKEIEESKGPIRLKYQVARAAFAGQAYNQGTSPFQEFTLLFKLRDEIVHLKAEKKIKFSAEGKITSIQAPGVIERLPKNILASFNAGDSYSWLDLVNTPATARWSCNTASKMVLSILDVLPAGEFKEQVTSFYKVSFLPVK